MTDDERKLLLFLAKLFIEGEEEAHNGSNNHLLDERDAKNLERLAKSIDPKFKAQYKKPFEG